MNKQPNRDVFAEIAAQRVVYRTENMIEPGPPELPDRILPALDNNPHAAFTTTKHMSTAEELQKELAQQREFHQPYMQDLAPTLESMRQSFILEQAHWRVATETDRTNFGQVLAGKGQWQQVELPHYGPPLGNATTYYRIPFDLAQVPAANERVYVCFKGVDYRAQVFVNGSHLGGHEGFYAPFEFDFTACAVQGENVLVVQVENDFACQGSTAADGQRHEGDKIYAATGLGYDEPVYGWHHCPPGMGICQDVFIETRPKVHLSDCFVRPLPDENRAEAWIEVFNPDLEAQEIELDLSLYGQNFTETVFTGYRYQPSTTHTIGFGDAFQEANARSNGNFNKAISLRAEKGVSKFVVEFTMNDFRWWDLEHPWLYQLQVRLKNDTEQVVDTIAQQFGMRSFTMDETSSTKGAMKLNGKPIRLRGANTMGHMQQCVLKKDWQQLVDDILLAKICNMNFFRLTQRPVQKEVYEYCDRLGIMTQTDFPTFGVLRYNQYFEALRQVGEMEKLIRPHACNVIISYMNEPNINSGNKPHRNLNRTELEGFFQSADIAVRMLNPERVIKAVDGDYDPPAPHLPDRHAYPCWYNGQGVDLGKLYRGYWQPVTPGWYYGCGEFGAEGLEDEGLMRRHYPKDWLPANPEEDKQWTPNWIPSAQTGNFHYFFFDTPRGLSDWIEKSQTHQQWATKIMTEAFRLDARMVSFAIHLFIDAFPSGWMKTIMDCERQPKKAYFAYRDALAPILPVVRSDRNKFFAGETPRFEIWICNDQPESTTDLMLHYQLEIEGQPVCSNKVPASVPACSSAFQGYLQCQLPEVSGRTKGRIHVAVLDNNQVINDNSFELDVFPETADQPASNVTVLGQATGPARCLAEELGCSINTGSDLVGQDALLIDDWAAFEQQRDQVLRAVELGAHAIFMDIPVGMYQIENTEITVKSSSFNPLHFASRNTGHRLVSDFESTDFKLWYDPQEDMISPIVYNTFTSEDFSPILTSGNLNPEGQWDTALVVGEKKLGRGTIFFSTLKIAGRTGTNPVARAFAQKLLAADQSLDPQHEAPLLCKKPV